MPFPLIPQIAMSNIVRVKPALTGLREIRVSNNKNLLMGAVDPEIKNAILIGKVKEHTLGSELYNANVWLDVSRPKVVLVFGRRGSGKSYDLGVLIEGLASGSNKIKVGVHKPPIVVFDPLNQFWTLSCSSNPQEPEEEKQLELISRWGLTPEAIENVNIFLPRGTPKRHPESIEFSIDVAGMDVDDWCGFFKVDKYSDPVGQLINSAFTKVTESGYSTSSSRRRPKSDYALSDLIDCIEEDSEINDPQRGFSRQTCRAVLSRLNELQRMPLFTGKGADIKKIFAADKLSIFMLREVDEATRSVVVGQIVKKILQARGNQWECEEIAKRLKFKASKAMQANPDEARKLEIKSEELLSEAETKGIPAGWIVIDEAHVLCPSEGVSASKEILIEYVKQGRAMGLSLAAATQQPSALSSRLISQRDIILVHNLGIKSDMDAAVSQMNPNFADEIIEGRNSITTGIPFMLMNCLKKGEAILSTDEASRNFVILIRPRVTPHGGKEPVSV